MRKIILTSLICLLPISIIADEQFDLNEGVMKLNKATTLLIKKFHELENELSISQNEIKTLNEKMNITNNKIIELEKLNAAPKIKTIENTVPIVDKVGVNHKIVVTVWIANLRNNPSLKDAGDGHVYVGESFNVVKEVGNFYLLDNGKYLHNSTTNYENIEYKTIKTNTFAKQFKKDKLFNTKKYYTGQRVEVISMTFNKKWFILNDGTLLNINDVNEVLND